jgi:hypothetical protein
LRIEEAFEMAKRDFLPQPGVVGVSYRDNVIVIYVEDEETAKRMPTMYMGFRVLVKVVGKVIAI